jgi:hypothetical protein
MRPIVKRRGESKFVRFMRSYGVVSLAAELDIRSSAIYHWIRGATTPRPAHAIIIQRLARESGVKLTFDQIYQHSRDLRAVGDESVGSSLKSLATGFSDDGDPRERIRARRGNVAASQWM